MVRDVLYLCSYFLIGCILIANKLLNILFFLSVRARWKVLAYNQHETLDKRPFGRDPDRSWCHLHTSEAGCNPRIHGARSCDQKSFIVLVVWQWHQLLFGSLPNGRLSRVSYKLGQELFTLPSYICRYMLEEADIWVFYIIIIMVH